MNYFSEFLTGYVHVTEKYDYRSPNNVKSITLNLQQYNLFAKKIALLYYFIHILEFPDFSKTLRFQNGKKGKRIMPASIKVQNVICLDKDEKRKNKATPLPLPQSFLQYYHIYIFSKLKLNFIWNLVSLLIKLMNVFVNSFIVLLLKWKYSKMKLWKIKTTMLVSYTFGTNFTLTLLSRKEEGILPLPRPNFY